VLGDAGSAEVHARLTRYNGFVRELPLTPVDGLVPTWQADQALAVLATGPYALELEARVPGGIARERVEFSIAP
jgi:hypothetical protein